MEIVCIELKAWEILKQRLKSLTTEIEMMKNQCVYCSQRTLQNLRDNNTITDTTIGGKILYPENELQNVLVKNLRVERIILCK